ncbi:MAG: hypothetical protein FJW39_31510 [Acidobacteria bacterium]|nr:hypothetical protein [Acidobacteriota bacterium]
MSRAFHEPLDSLHESRPPSERSFGLTLAAVCAIAQFWYAAVALASFAIIAPAVLAPFNRMWFRLGRVLGRVTSPVVMALVFFLVITPLGLLMRLLGRDALGLRRDAASYWATPDPPGSMRRQF